MSLMDIHRQLFETPRLRSYRWLVNGMTSFNAFQGAVALASCLLDQQDAAQRTRYTETFDATVVRFRNLVTSSPVCAKTYPVLENLLYVSSCNFRFEANWARVHLANHLETTRSEACRGDPFEQWMEQMNFLETDPSDWVSDLQKTFLRALAHSTICANKADVA